MSLLPVGFGGSASGYDIAKSVRFRSNASASLTRTFSASGTQATFSMWVKRGALGVAQELFGWTDGVTTSYDIHLNASNQLDYWSFSGGYTARRLTTAVFRDPSAWFHLLCVHDTPNATASSRMRVYVNGVQITSFSASVDPAQNSSLNLSGSRAWRIGGMGAASPTQFFDGYIAEFHLIDGQALDPTSFGQFDANGVWVAKKYAGTYGTNGFYLPFDNGTSLTTLAQDRSGNGNNWTATNVSLTAGSTYDWMDDTPTNNFAVLNSVAVISPGGQTVTRDANLTLFMANGSPSWPVDYSYVSIQPTSGKFYVEFSSNQTPYLGYPYLVVGGALSTTLTTGAVNEVVCCAIDFDTGQAWRSINSTPNTAGAPTHTFGAGQGGMYFCIHNFGSNNGCWVNFGQRPFAYTPPTGFKALSTKNRPTGGSITTSGTFTGNASTDGPFVWLNGNPSTMTINGNAVTFGTHADKTAGGFKVRSLSASYNTAGSNTYSVTFTGKLFGDSSRAPNTAQGNP